MIQQRQLVKHSTVVGLLPSLFAPPTAVSISPIVDNNNKPSKQMNQLVRIKVTTTMSNVCSTATNYPAEVLNVSWSEMMPVDDALKRLHEAHLGTETAVKVKLKEQMLVAATESGTLSGVPF
jgi:hypothetical protein